MTKPKGGRGKKAPYSTKLMRVPVPMKPQVRQLVDRYQSYLTYGGDALNPSMLLGDSESLNNYAGSKLKGGRGKKAPYTATLMRVPVPLANQVNRLIERYLGYISLGGNPAEPASLLGEAKLINSLSKSVNMLVKGVNNLNNKDVNELSINERSKASKVVNDLKSKPVNDLANSNRERIEEVVKKWQLKMAEVNSSSPRWHFARKMLAELEEVLLEGNK